MFEIALSEVSLFLFTLFNGIRVFSYLPQIVRIAQDTEGAKAISYVTWAVWIGANGSTALYAWINLHDLALALLNGANASCCGVVIGLTVWKRRSFATGRRHMPLALEPATAKT